MIYSFITILVLALCALTGFILLWRRGRHRRKVRSVRRTDNAYSKERDYGSTARVAASEPATIDAHDFLDYARFRAEVAAFVMKEFDEHPDMAVVGFLTGSVGPLVTARHQIGQRVGHRVRYAQGLAHFSKKDEAEKDYHAILDDLWASGVRHFVLADELIGGGSIGGILGSTITWLQSRTGCHPTFSVLAFRDQAESNPSKSVADIAVHAVDKSDGRLNILTTRELAARKLLEKDKAGIQFRVVKADKKLGEYALVRTGPTGLLLKCPTGGKTGGGGAGSLDQIFGGLIEDVIGIKPPRSSRFWPETIQSGDCEECRQLLRAARQVIGVSRSATR